VVFGLGFLIAALVSAMCATGARTGTGEAASITFRRGSSIYLISFDGRRLSRLLRGGYHSSACLDQFLVTCPGSLDYSGPDWSSGGRLAVAVASTPDEGNSSECVAVFTPKLKLMPRALACEGQSEPSWAPDGTRLALAGTWGENFLPLLEIWQLGAHPGFRALVKTGRSDPNPAWSPDGSQIAFARGSSAAPRLYLIRPDGRGSKQLLTSHADNASWSPDDRRLAFDDGHRIAVIDRDGKNLRYLTRPGARDRDPAWARDGRWIAFVRYRSKQSQSAEVWVMDTNGRHQRLLARNATQPAWKP
jgi:dipeptidyl aminopeptidase/acylaminoacyl peptidase